MSTVVTHLFLDFDETLFDHYQYAHWLDEQLHAKGLLIGGKGSFVSTMDDHHDLVAVEPVRMRLYRHADHLMNTTGKSWDVMSAEIEKLAVQQDRDFCYEGAHALIDSLSASTLDIRVLTYGDGEYQRYKIGICKYGALSALPVHVVGEPKREFLAREFADIAVGVLIDDKYPLNLPLNWVQFWINRAVPVNEPIRIEPQVIQISSLDQVHAALALLRAS